MNPKTIKELAEEFFSNEDPELLEIIEKASAYGTIDSAFDFMMREWTRKKEEKFNNNQ